MVKTKIKREIKNDVSQVNARKEDSKSKVAKGEKKKAKKKSINCLQNVKEDEKITTVLGEKEISSHSAKPKSILKKVAEKQILSDDVELDVQLPDPDDENDVEAPS